MKKIVGIMGAALMLASSMFAADFAARVYLTGNIADGTIDITDDDKNANGANFWKLNKTDQKDADALVISTNGDKAGANFQFWYNYAGDDAALKVRSTNIWFKPVEMLKVTVGDIDVGTYKETIDWWKVAVGNGAGEHNGWSNGSRWSSTATVAGSGISLELTPVAGLMVTAGLAAPVDSVWGAITPKEDKGVDFSYAKYGAAVKYDFNGLLGLPLTAGASWRDDGKDSFKIAAVGADFGNNWANGFYGMLNVRLFMDKTSIAGTTEDGVGLTAKLKDIALSGIAFDNYFKYQAGAFKVQARLPVTVRGLATPMVDEKSFYEANKIEAKDADPSYMSYEIYATYGLTGCTIYCDIENDNAVTFNSNFLPTFLNMTVQPGVTLNVGSCAIDLGVNFAIPTVAKDDKDAWKVDTNLAWSVPFTLSVAF